MFDNSQVYVLSFKKPIQNVGEDGSGSEVSLPVGQLWVFSAPNTVLSQVRDLLAEFGLAGRFLVQPLEANASQLQLKFDQNLDVADLVSRLARLGLTFELESAGDVHERYLHHPALGICRNEIDIAGEVVLRAGQLEHLLLETGGNISDFSRGFRRLTAVPWLDLIEPYRKSAEYLHALPRAV